MGNANSRKGESEFLVLIQDDSVHGDALNDSQEFMHLGSVLSTDCCLDREIENRIRVAFWNKKSSTVSQKAECHFIATQRPRSLVDNTTTVLLPRWYCTTAAHKKGDQASQPYLTQPHLSQPPPTRPTSNSTHMQVRPHATQPTCKSDHMQLNPI
ncbi:hypothetical protein HELRODRAFT_178462 [Helobdella robusta]|uniref:Uncharacterized protein n=1 Tax=Helobdella robusta TaxID=6412 RepID=T1FD70_HELRO|nr:hypothetical protein HELRODRAFT_178462 [Helobdella robusta]ESN97019.1 hypothetical protein HELRODRAFT_178462 [Helobdella robusta]